MSMLIRLVVIALFANWCLPLSAQTLIKCKQPNGSYSFQDTPCASSANQETLRIDPRGGGLKPVSSASQEASGTSAVEPKSTTSRLPPTATPAPGPAPETVRSPAAERMPEPATEPTPEPVAPTISRAEPETKSPPDSTADREKAMSDTWSESTKSAKADNSVVGGKLILLGIGGIIIILCSIWLLILAFQESLLWGLLCFFISFPCQLIFVFTHWDKSKAPFLISIGGAAVMVLSVIV